MKRRSFYYWLSLYDARHRLPRARTAPHLPTHLAFFKLMNTAGQMLLSMALSVAAAYLLILASGNFQLEMPWSGCFYGAAVICVLIGILEAGQYLIPFYRFQERATYGSAQWADDFQLRDLGLVREKGEPLRPGDVRLGKLHSGRDLVLPLSVSMRHLAFFGPPGSGKSSTFLYNLLAGWSRTGSAIVLDPKGELYAKTAMHFQRAYRFDLQQPERSDRWNFMLACRRNTEFANEMATIILGLEGTKHTVTDPFWKDSETAALTAVLLHLPEIIDHPTPSMIVEFLASRSLHELNVEMMSSPNPDARINWGVFTKAKPETQGSVITGINTKCNTFRISAAAHAMAALTDREREIAANQEQGRNDGRGGTKRCVAHEIDLRTLRTPGTAIYVVIPEGDATRYRTVLATLFGLASSVLRKTEAGGRAPDTPVLFVCDEAGNLPIHGLKEMLGVGRGRRIGIVLGYQNIPQVYAQYGEEEGGAVLGSVGTMVFLPGLDIATSEYAAKRIGETTVQQHTSVDAHGSRFDSERSSEVGRLLIDAAELRQLLEFNEAVAVMTTAPPVRFVFPDRCQLSEAEHAVAPVVGAGEIVSLRKAEQMRRVKRAAAGMPDDADEDAAGESSGGEALHAQLFTQQSERAGHEAAATGRHQGNDTSKGQSPPPGEMKQGARTGHETSGHARADQAPEAPAPPAEERAGRSQRGVKGAAYARAAQTRARTPGVEKEMAPLFEAARADLRLDCPEDPMDEIT